MPRRPVLLLYDVLLDLWRECAGRVCDLAYFFAGLAYLAWLALGGPPRRE